MVTYYQPEQLGTGHAVLRRCPWRPSGNLLVLVGDAPLIRPETLTGLIAAHETGGYAATANGGI